MHEYEVLIEEMTPCGGSKYAKKDILEVQAESPETYVREHGKWPVRDISRNGDGDLVITTSDCAGNIQRFTFTE